MFKISVVLRISAAPVPEVPPVGVTVSVHSALLQRTVTVVQERKKKKRRIGRAKTRKMGPCPAVKRRRRRRRQMR